MLRRPGVLLSALWILSLTALGAPVVGGGGGLPGVSTPAAQEATGSQRQPRVAPVAASKAAPLRARVRPDVLVVTRSPLSPATVARLTALAATPQHIALIRLGTLRVGSTPLPTMGVDPSRFRGFAPEGTAEADGVWDSLAGGDIVVAYDTAAALELTLGAPVPISDAAGAPTRSVWLGALATSGLPGVAALLSNATASAYRLPAANGAVLSAGRGDPKGLALAVRREVGPAGTVRQLSSSHQQVATLHGGPAQSLGSFSYRYYPDGTLVPDPAWVRANIVVADVPILGRVQCHRLMIPQLRAALGEVLAAGLAGSIHPGEYAGCYNSRFIDRNPREPISLHTWGIALDLNVPGNQRGTRGQMDRRVVLIFTRWGFAWGGDWAYPDPMHFELATLVTPRPAVS